MWKRKRENEKFINNFLSEDNLTKNQSPCKTNISVIKNTVTNVYRLNKQLRNLANEMKNVDNFQVYYEKSKEVYDELKVQTQKLMELKKLDIKSIVVKRQKSRKRLKNKKKSYGLQKEQTLERRTQLNNQIDKWRAKKENEIKRERDEKVLRMDADLVLSDIKSKQSDVKKFLGVLKELEHFRKIKVTMARSRGEKISLESDAVFNNIIIKLKEHWSILEKEYAIEEKGLKLMIKTDNEKRINKSSCDLINEWQKVFFTKLDASKGGSYKELISVRYMWDHYIDIFKGSEIPVGWVMQFITQSSNNSYQDLYSSCENEKMND